MSSSFPFFMQKHKKYSNFFNPISFASVWYILIQMCNGNNGIICQCGTHIQILTHKSLRFVKELGTVRIFDIWSPIENKFPAFLLLKYFIIFLKKFFISLVFYNIALFLGLFICAELWTNSHMFFTPKTEWSILAPNRMNRFFMCQDFRDHFTWNGINYI